MSSMIQMECLRTQAGREDKKQHNNKVGMEILHETRKKEPVKEKDRNQKTQPNAPRRPGMSHRKAKNHEYIINEA